VYLPVGGKVIEINDGLMDIPEMINSDPYVNGWIIKIEIADDSDLDDLMDAAAYEANTKERG
jgi:glycine cleavage system H protein